MTRVGAAREKIFHFAAQLPRSCLQRAASNGHLGGMKRDAERLTAIGHREPAIEALLSRPEADSIVDLLLSLPANEIDEADTFNRIVKDRLEAKLADRVRSLIGDDEHQRAA
jgi:hypothetical protein